MKNATQCAKKLTALLKKLPDPGSPDGASDEAPDEGAPAAADPLDVLVESFLMTETTSDKARTAYRRLRQNIVDFNDLRVTMPHEMAEALGSRYPGAFERCQRIRRVLRGVYLREHEVTLERLVDVGKREVKTYFETLDGMLPYAAARVMLLCFDVHAVPVDEQLRGALIRDGAADESADVGEIGAWIARQVKAGDRLVVHRKLQAWMDAGGGRKPAGRKTAGTRTRRTGTTGAKRGARSASTTKKTSRSKKKSGASSKRGSKAG